MTPSQPDYQSRECWKRDHDRCTGYTDGPEWDADLCDCQCHDDAADEYMRAGAIA